MDHNLSLSVDGVPQTVALADKIVTGAGNAVKPWNELLLNSMKSMIATAGDATNFLVGQVPDVLHQVVLWFMVYNLVLFTTGILIIIAVLVMWLKFGKHREGKWSLLHNDKGELEIHSIPTIGVSLGALWYGTSLLNLLWLQCWIAPKLFLINYAVQLGQQVVK